jgi:FMN-dependent NADH-azoreductase
MSNILAVYSSVAGEQSSSKNLATYWLSQKESQQESKQQSQQHKAQLVELDLSQTEVPHLTAKRVEAFYTPTESLTPAQQEDVALSNQWVEQLQQADTLVIAVPLYNFGIPSTLKAWFDHIARAGVTFKYGENGPEGLLKGKKAVVIASRGGQYKDSGFDFQVPFIKQFLSFIGIDDVSIIYAEGLAMGDEVKSKSFAAAKEALSALSVN